MTTLSWMRVLYMYIVQYMYYVQYLQILHSLLHQLLVSLFDYST